MIGEPENQFSLTRAALQYGLEHEIRFLINIWMKPASEWPRSVRRGCNRVFGHQNERNRV